MTGVFIVTHMESLLSRYCFIDLKLEQFPCRKINQSFGIPYHSTAWILSLHPFIQTKRSICWFGLSCPFANLLILRTSSWASLLSDFGWQENVDLLFLPLSLGKKIMGQVGKPGPLIIASISVMISLCHPLILHRCSAPSLVFVALPNPHFCKLEIISSLQQWVNNPSCTF